LLSWHGKVEGHDESPYMTEGRAHSLEAHEDAPAHSALQRLPAATRAISRRPLLKIAALTLRRHADPFCFLAQGNGRAVSSGRAAIFHSLRMLGVRRDDVVLVPTYHCPTLVAPVLALGARPSFYPLIEPGLPDTARIARAEIDRARAIVVPQLFGLPLDLAPIRAWCDRNGIPMVEDCAHSLFGKAGALLSGQWGDYATASLTKFFPVSELGWLYSSRRSIPEFALRRASARNEIKGLLDPLQLAAQHDRLGPLGTVLRQVSGGHGRRQSVESLHQNFADVDADTAEVARFMRDCDLGRIEHAPARVSLLIARLSNWAAISERRRRNYCRIGQLIRSSRIGSSLQEKPPETSGPYVFPLLVDNPGMLYPEMRRLGFPVYRWDRQWPGTPRIEGDLAFDWRYRLLQIPVHQSYSDEDFELLDAQLQQLAQLVGRERA